MSQPAPRVVWYGDDFTGATDTLATLARHGVRALLFPQAPSPARLAAAGPLDAVGVAGAARGMTPEDMAAELAPVGAFFAASSARVLHYKCCSTFDSAPHVGSIGAAVRLLKPHAPNPLVSVVGGQPSLGRYCLFGNLFAAAGAGGAVHRIDRHPTMARHPVTPMGEADLGLHLAAQGLADLGRVSYPAYAAGADRLGQTLDRLAAQHPAGVLLDVSRQEELLPIGAALWAAAQRAPLLAVGASSVAQALAAAWGADPVAEGPTVRPAEGPVFVLAGSLSPVTRRQVEAATAYVRRAVSPERLVADEGYRAALLADIAALLGHGRHVLAITDRPDEGPAVPPAAVATATARLLADVLARVPLRRVGVCGGDTSSHAAQALAPWALGHAADLSPGVALCLARFDDPARDGLELMLKGGQMGPENVLDLLVEGTG
ncbi:hypothetical protein SLNSH_19930 [Alsobacter soli]|uniref:Four-carbon acid sugar kinase family protein n=1 Tax=Alsobacter soli TaxID=2109933 RepID=A0A2T1HNJ3_9HYPH|nr:four-carbon acid sugar kinase family protein [Alsobacter soli]PSC03216.1 hypothetical protein SLNSH_19930 [Alsobacter soli]